MRERLFSPFLKGTVFFLAGCLFWGPASRAQVIRQVCFGERCISVETAESTTEQLKGLMFRESLPSDHGMLFIYEEEIFPVMYMKNMRIPLDFIWINSDGRVVDLRTDVPVCAAEPCPRYTSSEKALYVLEINRGEIARYSVQKGDFITFRGEGGVKLEARPLQDDNEAGVKMEDLYDTLYGKS